MRDKLRRKKVRPTRNATKRYNRGMNNYEWMTVWTAMWLIFICVLCVAFNSAMPLWLLIIWTFGF